MRGLPWCVSLLTDDPKGKIVHHPYTAFNQGQAAHGEFWNRIDNPYEDGSREGVAWDRGWMERDGT